MNIIWVVLILDEQKKLYRNTKNFRGTQKIIK